MADGQRKVTERAFPMEGLLVVSTYAIGLIGAFDEGDVPHEPGLTAHMAGKTEGYSGADLRGVMARLRQLAFDRRAQLYTYALADEVLAATPPTTSEETVRRIREWERSAC